MDQRFIEYDWAFLIGENDFLSSSSSPWTISVVLIRTFMYLVMKPDVFTKYRHWLCSLVRRIDFSNTHVMDRCLTVCDRQSAYLSPMNSEELRCVLGQVIYFTPMSDSVVIVFLILTFPIVTIDRKYCLKHLPASSGAPYS